MASTGLTAVMNPQQHSNLHPFFIQVSNKDITTKSYNSEEASTGFEPLGGNQPAEAGEDGPESTNPLTKRRLEARTGLSERVASEDGMNDSNDVLEIDPNFGRRKRVKSVEPGAAPEALQQGSISEVQEKDIQIQNRHTAQVIIPVSHLLVDSSAASSGSESRVQNGQRTLKLSGKGTLGSPTSVKTSEPLARRASSKSRTKKKDDGTEESVETPLAGKRRPPKGKKSQMVPNSRIVTVKYDNKDLGQKISQILNSQGSLDPPSNVKDSKERIEKAVLNLPPHPFFVKSKKQAGEPNMVSSEVHVLVESVSIQPQSTLALKAASMTTPQPSKSAAHSMFGIISREKPQSLARHNTRHPPWPWKGVTRVDYQKESDKQDNEQATDDVDLDLPKKRKSAAVFVTSQEDIIGKKLADLRLGDDNHLSIESLRSNLRAGLRSPRKLILTGPKMKAYIVEQMSNGRASLDTYQLHPAIQHLYSNLGSYLSPFDKYHCETQSWTQKYAPSSAEQVLQSGMEAQILKNWLISLQVNRVDTGKAQEAGSEQPKRMGDKPKKKRKRASDLDDFIVSESDEEGELGELEYLEDASRPVQRRSMVRQSQHRKPNSRKIPMANTVLLSGPSGCGKSAAVFAISRELDFEIFEINSGSRRSGKDILDRIGNMAENHLVQVVSKAVAEASSEKPKKETENANAPDSPSSHQGSMTSFFKPVATKAAPKQGLQNGDNGPKVSNVNKPTRQQKQSLILFEEVDVLFSEDKQFWATVVALAVHSKRPIVLTCNDETLVPLDILSLHAILRLEPPPVTLATEYLLTIAATEGHILEQTTVRDLYAATGEDLRRSISTLDFFCQMAVGDQKGGLDWLIDRWPVGSDLDENGHKLRVISDGTYLPGMDWKNYDIAALDRDTTQGTEHELNMAMKEWGISLEEIAYEALICEESWKEGNGSLADFVAISESLSSADIYCRFSEQTGMKEALDPSYPDRSEKLCRDNIEGSCLLNSEPRVIYHGIETQMAASLLCQISALCNLPTPDPFNLIISRSKVNGKSNTSLFRKGFAPLDPLGDSDGYNSGAGLTMCSLDGAFRPIVEDVAPYVREIAAFDHETEAEKARLALTLDGRPARKIRLTRVSRSALDGGRRELKRRDRWFSKDLNLLAVLETGSKDWMRARMARVEEMQTWSAGVGGATSVDDDEDD